jgi:methyltransferase (TIGR00027 family)
VTEQESAQRLAIILTEGHLHDPAPSRTALGAAAYRAAHQVLDKPVVFADPLAIRILGEAGAAALERQLDPDEAQSWRRLRAFIAARSRFTEEALAEAVRNGIRQFVVLGAGLDTFAYRNPYGPRLTVFEVDHPATQAFKRAQLAAARIDVPPSLSFVPVDFERESLIAALRTAGFRRRDPALFSWLGVTMYPERARVLETLADVARGAGPGTNIIFDYARPPASVGDAAVRARYEALIARHAALGEPWRSLFDPPELDAALRRAGFAAVRDWDQAALNARYFAGRADGLEVAATAHLIEARV